MPQVRTVTPNGASIRAARLALGLSPQQVADRMGQRHAQTIRKLERGAIPNASELLIHQLALALRKPVDDLILQDAA